MVMFEMTDSQFQLVYNVLSFSLASMMATTLFLWMRVPAINAKYQSALLISGLVTFIAAYHYIRIFNSWTEAYAYPAPGHSVEQWPASGAYPSPKLTGVPFNDAYRYMDWLLTVPLLLIEIVLTMKMSPEETATNCKQLGLASALMICAGYPGELIVEGDLSQRWVFWAAAMVPFLFVVSTLLVGLADATNRETNAEVKSLIQLSQYVTVISWLTYPVVYIFPMLGFKGAHVIVAIQCGYCCSDIISKCGVGLIIYQITLAKSALEDKGGSGALGGWGDLERQLGTAGSGPRAEAARKLITNRDRVLNDVCNPARKSQREIATVVPAYLSSYVENGMKECARRLLTGQSSGPASSAEREAWMGMATVMEARLQTSSAQCTGRAPDMGPEAGAALRGALQELRSGF